VGGQKGFLFFFFSWKDQWDEEDRHLDLFTPHEPKPKPWR